MSNLGLSADELLSTTRAVRKRLDFDRPVSDDLLRECVNQLFKHPRFQRAGLAFRFSYGA